MGDIIARGIATRNKKQNSYGYNLDNALFRYRANLAKANQSIVKIGCIGDSITEGYFSGNNDELAWPVRLRVAMQAKYGGTDEGFVPVKDSDRFINAGAWDIVDWGVACYCIYSFASGATLTFTFTGTAVDVVFAKHEAGGIGTVTIDGVSKAGINCAGNEGDMGNLASYAGLANAEHTVVITAPADGTGIFIEGAICHQGDTKGIRVDRRGCYGSLAQYWNDAFVKNACFTKNPCDLYIIALGGNDCMGARTQAQLKSDLDGIIQTALVTGSVVLVPMWQGDLVTYPELATWGTYQSLFYELADQYNIGVIDLYSATGKAFEPANTYGLFHTDGLHASIAGQQFIADLVYRYIV